MIREVPVTQEVYISPDSHDSVIIEILERVSQSDSVEAARSTICISPRAYLALTFAFSRFHFEAIAHDNDAVSFSVDDVNEVPINNIVDIPFITILHGRQGVRKFNRTSVDDVRISLALYRLEQKGVDLVLSRNLPMRVEDAAVRTEEQYDAAKETFRSIATSLRIVDFDLFV